MVVPIITSQFIINTIKKDYYTMNKSLKRNSLYNTFYRCINVIYPLITATYTARVLHPAGVGAVAYAQNIAQYFVLLAPMGIPNYGIRQIATSKKLNKTFSELFLINTLSTTLCALAYYLFVWGNSGFLDKRLYFITGITILLNYLNVDWFYQGKEDYKYISIRNMCIKIISLVAVLSFVQSAEDYRKYALIYALGIAGNNILNVFNLRKYDVKLDLSNLEIKKHLQPVFILLATTIAIEIYNLLDTTMIGFVCDATTVAYYTNSIKLVKVLTTVIASIGGVLLPRLSLYAKEGKLDECSNIVNKVIMIITFFSVPAMVGILGCADLIIDVLYGKAFAPSVPTLCIGSLLILVLGYSTILGNQVMIAFGKEKELFKCTIVGAVLNVVLNAVLIPKYQQNGAIIASVASEICVTVGTFIYSGRILRIGIQPRFVKGITLQTIIMAAILLVLRHIVLANDLLQLIICVAVCGFAYIVVGLVVNREFIGSMIKIKDRK